MGPQQLGPLAFRLPEVSLALFDAESMIIPGRPVMMRSTDWPVSGHVSSGSSVIRCCVSKVVPSSRR